MLNPQTSLPVFSLKNELGDTVDNQILHGTWSILYFYPKDNTPGCTTQACSLRDSYGELRKLGVDVYGISGDSSKAHQKFKNDFNLPFSLLIDSDHEFAKTMDVWVEKSLYGKKYMGIERSTYIINPEGIIIAAYQKVHPDEHGSYLLQEMHKFLD